MSNEIENIANFEYLSSTIAMETVQKRFKGDWLLQSRADSIESMAWHQQTDHSKNPGSMHPACSNIWLWIMWNVSATKEETQIL